MRSPLTIAVAQPSCTPYDIAANIAAHAAVVRSVDSRVVVFPELSLTGYELDAPALSVDDPRLAPLIEACAETGSMALVGAPVPGEHIGMLAVDATGATVAYRKIHLRPPEDQRFVPGDRPTALDIDGWRLGLAICKDTGLPEHAEATSALGIDVYVAGVLFSPRGGERRDERLRTIAVKHGVHVAAACFAGPTGDYPETSGGSGIWAPDGTLITQADSEVGGVAVAKLI